MAIAFVQNVTGLWSSGTSFTTSLTATSGNLLAVAVWTVSGDGSDKFSSIGDTVNTYTCIDGVVYDGAGILSGAKHSFTTWYVKNATGGALTVTVNLVDSTMTWARVSVSEYSGADTSSPLDVHAMPAVQINPGTGTDAVTSGNVTTTANNELVVGWSANAGQAEPSQPFTCTGFTSRRVSGTAPAFATGDLIKAVAGSTAALFTMGASDANTNEVTAVATFKEAASAGWGGLLSDRLNRLVITQ